MTRCAYCDNEAAVFVPYQKKPLCKEHFIKHVVDNVKRTIERFRLINGFQVVAVGMSGGKDSAVLLDILSKLRDEPEFRFEIVLIHIDLGITENNFSHHSLDASLAATKRAHLYLNVVKVEDELGLSLPDLVKHPKIYRPPCALCGILKRYILNKTAYELGATVLATGHLMDDEATFLLSNFVAGQKDLIARSGPAAWSNNPKLISRIKPLYHLSEYESQLYADFSKVPYTKVKCPFHKTATTTSFKDVLRTMEQVRAGSTRQLLKEFREVAKIYKRKISEEIKACSICGFPTAGNICAFCRIKNIVKN